MRSSSWASSSLSAAAFLALAFVETHLPNVLGPSGPHALHSFAALDFAALACSASSVAVFLAVCETHLP